MGLREELQKRIERKQAEIHDYEVKIREANAYLQGLMDTLKLVPRDDNSQTQATDTVRHGSKLAKARDAIKAAGKPLHITDILKAIGQTNIPKHRVSLAGSLAAYVRKGEVFTRPAPNTFGLVEFRPATSFEITQLDEIPATGGEVLQIK